MKYFIPSFVLIVVCFLFIMGFRGSFSENTPIEVFPDMDRQAKFKSQTKNTLFNDNRADRLPIQGTVIRGNLISQDNVFSSVPKYLKNHSKTGKISDDVWVSKIPDEIGIDMSLIRLGKEKYDIHCAVCHGKYGNGKGVLSYFLGVAPKNLSDISVSDGTYLESAAPWTDGQIYNAITMGSASGVMLGLKDRLSPKERWAIVLYLRALQSYVSEATTSKSKKS